MRVVAPPTILLLAALAALVSAAQAGSATLKSGVATVTLNAVEPESVTISASVTAVRFTMAPGVTVAGSSAIPITTSWALAPGRTSIRLYGFFATPGAALTDGYSTPHTIPSSAVLGQVITGSPTSFTSFTHNGRGGIGVSGASLLLLRQTLAAGLYSGTRTDNLNIEIVTPAAIPAGNYTGTLTLEAQAN
jgi:hypothetical protein